MKTRRIPGTELDVSVVGLGCWAIGGKWWGDDVDDAESAAAVRESLDRGINLFDTAPLYGHGHADEILVAALGPRRHEVVIATKVGVRWGEEGEHARSDLDPAWIREDTEASLRRLKLDCIPLLQVHWPDEANVPLDDSLGALVRLREEGKIRHFGLCNYEARAMVNAADAGAVSLQTPYSMVRREYESSLGPAFAPAGDGDSLAGRVGVLAYEPLCRGLLTGKFTERPQFPDSDLRARDDRFRRRAFAKIQRMVQGLRHVAEHFDTTPGALAIAWTLRRAEVCAALVGAKRPEQVRQNASASRLVDREDVPWDVLDAMARATRV